MTQLHGLRQPSKVFFKTDLNTNKDGLKHHFFDFLLRFAAFSLAFCTTLHCVMLQIALCFAAYCEAFCCILRGVLLQKAFQILAVIVCFLDILQVKNGSAFIKREMQNHSNWQIKVAKSAQPFFKFRRFGAFYTLLGW